MKDMHTVLNNCNKIIVDNRWTRALLRNGSYLPINLQNSATRKPKLKNEETFFI